MVAFDRGMYASGTASNGRASARHLGRQPKFLVDALEGGADRKAEVEEHPDENDCLRPLEVLEQHEHGGGHVEEELHALAVAWVGGRPRGDESGHGFGACTHQPE